MNSTGDASPSQFTVLHHGHHPNRSRPLLSPLTTDQSPDQGNVTAAETEAAVLMPKTEPRTDSTTPSARKRRTPGLTGSRGVANLTADQLAKKRANDREAQRAIRERTKNTIEGLERRIRELEREPSYQELQKAFADRDRALEECAVLRRRLEAIVEIAANAGCASSNELANATAQHSPIPSRQTSSAEFTPRSLNGMKDISPYESTNLHTTLQSPKPLQQPDAGYHRMLDRSEMAMQRKWSPGLEYPPQATYAAHFDHSRPSQHIALPQDNGERLGVNFLLDSNNAVRGANGGSETTARVDMAAYTRLPFQCASTCPLDSLLNDFVHAQRNLLHAGASRLEVLGPEDMCFAGLDRNTFANVRSERQPIVDLLVDILSKFPDVSGQTEKVAALYIMAIVIRWHICPCEACFEKLPAWIRPTAAQLEKSHPTWCDYLPWPFMRNRLIAAYTSNAPVELETFFVPYTITLNLNWPYPGALSLETPRRGVDDARPIACISPVFEAHLRDLKNWSVGTRFAQDFPQLIDSSVRVEADFERSN